MVNKKNLLKIKEKIENSVKEYWLEHQDIPFKTPDDIPELPRTNANEWNDFYVPILLRRGAIPKDDLIIGKEYLGNCRNSERAVWTGNKFVYNRNKFGTTYQEEINHFQDDDGYDLFVPIMLIE